MVLVEVVLVEVASAGDEVVEVEQEAVLAEEMKALPNILKVKNLHH